jgi:protein TonB
MPTANDRLKQSFSARLWGATSISVLLHFLVLVAGPTLGVPDIATAETPPIVVQPPEAELPPPPAPVQRPATPMVSDVADPSATLPSIPFHDYVAPLTPPLSRAEDDALERYEAFVPSMKAPRLLNAAEAEQALRAAYPRLLRDAGIGGLVAVQLWLDETGQVRRAGVARSSGYAALDAAALEVVRFMKLTPAENRGRAVRVTVTVPVRFKVE